MGRRINDMRDARGDQGLLGIEMIVERPVSEVGSLHQVADETPERPRSRNSRDASLSILSCFSAVSAAGYLTIRVSPISPCQLMLAD